MGTKSLLLIFNLGAVFSILSNQLAYAQNNPISIMKVNYGELLELKINTPILFEDSLTIVLTSFSHKRSRVGGPTKATAYLTFMKGNYSEQVLFSMHGTDGDDTEDSVKYDSLNWKDYKVEMRNFHYDQSVGIIVFRGE